MMNATATRKVPKAAPLSPKQAWAREQQALGRAKRRLHPRRVMALDLTVGLGAAGAFVGLVGAFLGAW